MHVYLLCVLKVYPHLPIITKSPVFCYLKKMQHLLSRKIYVFRKKIVNDNKFEQNESCLFQISFTLLFTLLCLYI